MTALRWFTAAHGGHPLVVACPHAGGAASYYARWRAQLPTGWGLAAARYPGREDRLGDAFAPDIGALADEIVASLRGANAPVVLFGHSMGASVAHEVALRLEADDSGPRLLAVSARPAPFRLEPSTAPLDDDGIIDLLRGMGSHAASAFLDEPELRELVMPSLRHDHAIVAGYAPSESSAGSLHAPILAFGGTDDELCPPDELEHWLTLSLGGGRVVPLPGGHFFLDEQMPRILRELFDAVSAADR